VNQTSRRAIDVQQTCDIDMWSQSSPYYVITYKVTHTTYRPPSGGRAGLHSCLCCNAN